MFFRYILLILLLYLSFSCKKVRRSSSDSVTKETISGKINLLDEHKGLRLYVHNSVIANQEFLEVSGLRFLEEIKNRNLQKKSQDENTKALYLGKGSQVVQHFSRRLNIFSPTPGKSSSAISGFSNRSFSSNTPKFKSKKTEPSSSLDPNNTWIKKTREKMMGLNNKKITDGLNKDKNTKAIGEGVGLEVEELGAGTIKTFEDYAIISNSHGPEEGILSLLLGGITGISKGVPGAFKKIYDKIDSVPDSFKLMDGITYKKGMPEYESAALKYREEENIFAFGVNLIPGFSRKWRNAKREFTPEIKEAAYGNSVKYAASVAASPVLGPASPIFGAVAQSAFQVLRSIHKADSNIAELVLAASKRTLNFPYKEGKGLQGFKTHWNDLLREEPRFKKSIEQLKKNKPELVSELKEKIAIASTFTVFLSGGVKLAKQTKNSYLPNKSFNELTDSEVDALVTYSRYREDAQFFYDEVDDLAAPGTTALSAAMDASKTAIEDWSVFLVKNVAGFGLTKNADDLNTDYVEISIIPAAGGVEKIHKQITIEGLSNQFLE